MISFCEISRQNFPQHRYFVIWSLARASVRSSGGGGGGRELEENWVGDVCLDIKRLQISQGILTEINKKTKTNSHLNIQTKFHTKTKIEEVWHLWENSDQNGWQRIQLLSLPFLWLLSFGFFFFFWLRNTKHCGVIFPIYVPFFPIPPPVTFLSFSSGFPSFVLPHSGKEDLPPPAPSGVRSLQSGLTTCSLDCLWKESVSSLHDL